jgi:hypothetical protein
MRKNSWIWIAAGWFLVVRVSEYHALRIDLGHAPTWEGSLRYTAVEFAASRVYGTEGENKVGRLT